MSNSRKYFPPYSTHLGNIKVELDLTGYATKKDLDDITHVDTSEFALKTDLTALKTEVKKLDIPKLNTVLEDLAKLSNVVRNDVINEFNPLINEFNPLKTKVYGIYVSKYVLKSQYDRAIGN